jgi:hypothetical protein
MLAAMLGTWRQQHLPEIVANLANRPGNEAVRTHVADIQHYGFGVAFRERGLARWLPCNPVYEIGVDFHERQIIRRIFQVRVHRFLCMAADAECFMILSPIIIFLCVYMVRVQVFVVGRMAQINPTFFVFTHPAMFRSVARTCFSKANSIVVERRSIVGMHWQDGNEIFGVSRKIFIKRKSAVDLLAVPIICPVPFII